MVPPCGLYINTCRLCDLALLWPQRSDPFFPDTRATAPVACRTFVFLLYVVLCACSLLHNSTPLTLPRRLFVPLSSFRFVWWRHAIRIRRPFVPSNNSKNGRHQRHSAEHEQRTRMNMHAFPRIRAYHTPQIAHIDGMKEKRAELDRFIQKEEEVMCTVQTRSPPHT